MSTLPLLIPVALAVLLLGAACSTSPGSADRLLSAPPLALHLQQSSHEIERAWGPPGEKRLLNEDGSRELWTYRRLVGQHTKQTAVSTEEIPFVDPITGETRTMREPVFRNQRIETHEIIELIFERGLLVDTRRDIRQNSQFH